MPVPGISPVSLFMPGMAETQVGLSNIDRQRALAQALQQQSLEPIQAGASQGPLGSITAPISWTQALGKLGQGYVGGKMQQGLDEKQLALIKGLTGQYSGLFGSDQSTPAATSPQVQSAMSNTQPTFNELGMQGGGPGPTSTNAATLDQLGGPPQATRGLLQMPGMSSADSQLMYGANSQEYVKKLLEIMNPTENANLVGAGIQPGTPAAQAHYVKLLRKGEHIPLDTLRQNGIALDENGNVKAFNPPPIPGAFPQFQGGMPTGYRLAPGAVETQTALGNTPLQEVTNADQTKSYIPKAQLSAVAGAPVAGNNFGNIRPPGQSTGFQQFGTPEEGLAAVDKNLQSYAKQGINTLEGIISRWAPPSENNTQAYIADASKRLGVDPKQPLNMESPAVRQAVGTAIILHEQGPQKLFAQATGTGVNQPTGGGLGNAPRFGQTQAEQIQQARQTAGGKALDEQFAKDYASFVQGGAQDSAKQLSQLQDVTRQLSTPGAVLTGPVIGHTPDFLKSFSSTGQNAIAMRERVEEVVQRSLRAILGAQFTENEGKRLIERAYNPTLPESENAIRVGRLATQLGQAFQAKKDAAQYFEKNGTLSGWNGKLPTISDFDPVPQGSSTGTIGGNQALEAALRKYGG